MASARSICSSGVTQTGQPGPWIIRTPSGSSSSMPCRTIVWVWPPQTSMRVHGRVVAAWISSSRRRARTGSGTRRGTSRRHLPAGQGDADLLLDGVAHGAEHVQGALRLRLVDLADGEADVDDHVVADLGPGNVGQAGLLADAAVLDHRHRQPTGVVDLEHLPWDPEAHGAHLPSSRAAATAACPWLMPPSLQGTRWLTN